MKFILATASGVIEESKSNGLALAILVTFWHEVQARYGGFLFSDAVWLVTAVWAADFVLGSVLAIRASWRRDKIGRWNPTRALQSIGKWLLWMSVLFVCYALRTSGRLGFGPFASLIESAIVLAEATSCLRNAGRLAGARWLERFAGAGEGAIEHLADRAEQSADA